jgi:MbtH protein
MTHPFENDNATYQVLINDEAQYALWPSFIDVPRGWRIAHPPSSRQSCLDYVNQHWTDMRPRSLVEAMETEADRPDSPTRAVARSEAETRVRTPMRQSV